MQEKKPSPTVDLEPFELPCPKPDEASIYDDGYDRDSAREEIEETLPDSVMKVGIYDAEMDNFTSWQQEDHFFIYPWPDDAFDWALIRITWEDNWGRWEVEACARMANESAPLKAARRMLTALFGKWGYDLKSSEYRHCKSFLRRLTVSR